MSQEDEWSHVWRIVHAFAQDYEEDVVLIGGVAVYLHLLAAARKDLPVESTHDADLYVALASWSDIREHYSVEANRRLTKHQIVIDDVEFDIYLENHNGLRVAYADLREASVVLSGVRVAGLEHLLLLKLDAARDRWSSGHGAKDRRDIAKILILMRRMDPKYTLAQCTDEDMALLHRVEQSNVFSEIAMGNAHVASALRREARDFVDRLARRRAR